MTMKVRCIAKNPWYENLKLFGLIKYTRKTRGPKFDDIVTVQRTRYYQGEKGYHFIEWPGASFNAAWFIPIEETFEAVTFKEIKEKASVN